jgi:hypothetical protein
MTRLRTSLQIIHQSMLVIAKHRKLLLFPLLHIAGGIAVVAFFLIPFIAGLPEFAIPTVLDRLKDYGDNGYPTAVAVAFYLATMFVMTFMNVALYSEILNAFNGRRVSLTRGVTFAASKLRAIAVWSLLSGIVGGLIRQLEESIGGVGRWVLAFIGISWSVASVFAVPVIIREEKQSNPAVFLKLSGGLVKKTWGESVLGIAGIGALGLLAIVGTFLIGTVLTLFSGLKFFEEYFGPYMVIGFTTTALLCLAIAYLSALLNDVYVCGLYIYAAEGVVPEEFDEGLFAKAWNVKTEGRGISAKPPG